MLAFLKALNPLDLFKSVKSAAITVVVIATITLIGVLWWEKKDAENDLVDAKAQLATLKDDLFKEQVVSSGLRTVITTLEDTYEKLGENLKSEAETEKEIDNAPKEDDAPLAPVLRRTFDSVDRMLHNGKS